MFLFQWLIPFFLGSTPPLLVSTQLCVYSSFYVLFFSFLILQKEAPNTRKMPVDTSHRSSSSTSLPFPHDPPVFPFDPQHNPTQVQHPPHDVLMPSMVGKARKLSGNNHRTFHPSWWSEILLKYSSSVLVFHNGVPLSAWIPPEIWKDKSRFFFSVLQNFSVVLC